MHCAVLQLISVFMLLTVRALTWDVIRFICDPRVADLWTLLVHEYELINSPIFLPVA